MRILVVGAGGTGGYYGGRLAQAGRDVTFLVRPARAAQLREHGLQIVSPKGNATLAPALLTARELAARSGEAAAPFDLVLLGVKAYGLDQAMLDLAPAVGAQTLILPVLNGLRHMEVLQSRFGTSAVLGGVSRISATVDSAGRIVHLSPLEFLAYGVPANNSGVDAARLAALDAALGGAGFEVEHAADIDRELWEKWVFLATLGGITCLLRGTIGDIEAVPGGAALATALLQELAAIATASKQPPRSGFMAQVAATLSTPGSGLASSMYRDLQAGAAVEVEQILGDLALRAESLHVATPLLNTALAHLRVYQHRLTAAGKA